LMVLRAKVPVAKVAHAGLDVEAVEGEIRVDGAGDDLDTGEGASDGVEAAVGGEVGEEDDVFLGDVVVEDDADGHHGSGTGGDGGVHEEDVGVADVGGELAVVELRLAGGAVGLDEDLADGNLLEDAAEGLLHGGASAEDGDTADLGVGGDAVVLVAGRGGDGVRGKGELAKGLFDDEAGDALGEEEELVAGSVAVPEDGVHGMELLGLLEEGGTPGDGGGGGGVLGELGADAEGALLELAADVLGDEVDGDGVVEAAGDDDVGVADGGVDKVVKGGLDEAFVLLGVSGVG
jgi:hypothetical protein